MDTHFLFSFKNFKSKYLTFGLIDENQKKKVLSFKPISQSQFLASYNELYRLQRSSSDNYDEKRNEFIEPLDELNQVDFEF